MLIWSDFLKFVKLKHKVFGKLIPRKFKLERDKRNFIENLFKSNILYLIHKPTFGSNDVHGVKRENHPKCNGTLLVARQSRVT